MSDLSEQSPVHMSAYTCAVSTARSWRWWRSRPYVWSRGWAHRATLKRCSGRRDLVEACDGYVVEGGGDCEWRWQCGGWRRGSGREACRRRGLGEYRPRRSRARSVGERRSYIRTSAAGVRACRKRMCGGCTVLRCRGDVRALRPPGTTARNCSRGLCHRSPGRARAVTLHSFTPAHGSLYQ